MPYFVAESLAIECMSTEWASSSEVMWSLEDASSDDLWNTNQESIRTFRVRDVAGLLIVTVIVTIAEHLMSSSCTVMPLDNVKPFV